MGKLAHLGVNKSISNMRPKADTPASPFDLAVRKESWHFSIFLTLNKNPRLLCFSDKGPRKEVC